MSDDDTGSVSRTAMWMHFNSGIHGNGSVYLTSPLMNQTRDMGKLYLHPLTLIPHPVLVEFDAGTCTLAVFGTSINF